MVIKNAERLVVDTLFKTGYAVLINSALTYNYEEQRITAIPVRGIYQNDILCINRNLVLLDNTIRQCTDYLIDNLDLNNPRPYPAPDFLLCSIINVNDHDEVMIQVFQDFNFNDTSNQYRTYYQYSSNISVEREGKMSSYYNIMSETLHMGMMEYYNLCRAGKYQHCTSGNAMPRQWIDAAIPKAPGLQESLDNPLDRCYMITHPGFMEDTATVADPEKYARETYYQQHYPTPEGVSDKAQGQLLDIVERVPIPHIERENAPDNVVLPPVGAQVSIPKVGRGGAQLGVEGNPYWTPVSVRVDEEGNPEGIVFKHKETGETRFVSTTK